MWNLIFEEKTIAKNKKFYNLSQILLHWLIALLVFYQLVNTNDIQNAYQIFLTTGDWPNVLSTNTLLHIIIGFLILFFMSIRLFLRITLKVPPLPSQIPRPLKLLAKSSHFSIYFFLFLMPLTGIISWFFEVEFSMVLHTYFSKILLALILFHIIATLLHEGVLGNKILQRMFQHKEHLRR